MHKILEDAGVAKGVSEEEVMIMLALGSPRLLQAVKTKLAADKSIAPAELSEMLSTLDAQAQQYKQVQRGGVQKLIDKEDELISFLLQREIDNEQQQIKQLRAASAALDSLSL